MARNLLFIVHGMGVHQPGWEGDVIAKLEEVLGRYSEFAGDPKRYWDSVRPVAVSYDDILRSAVDAWRTHAGGIGDYVTAHGLAGEIDPQVLVDFAAKEPDFFWSHVVDVILYRFFPTYRDAIRARVARQIVSEVQTLPKKAFDDCAVLAHSLGTAVAHDTLHLLATSTFGGAAAPFDPLDSRFQAVVMLANTSRILQTDIKAYESVVRGGPRTSRVSNCSQFMSWRHEWDPVCLVRRFAPDGWPRAFNWVDSVAHFRHWNVHGFTHYLDNPRIHLPLLELACGSPVATPRERIRAIQDYEDLAGALQANPQVDAIVQEIISQARRLNENSDWATLLDVMARIREEILKLKPLI